MRYRIAILLVVCAMACGPKPQPVSTGPSIPSAELMDPGPFPQDYQIRIISWLRMNADDPDGFRILSMEPPVPRALDASLPDKNLRKGEMVWESLVFTQGYKGDPSGPTAHRFYFKAGVIQSVDLK
jgi:hypothetical protein